MSTQRPSLGIAATGSQPVAYRQWLRFHSLVDACAMLSEEEDYKHPQRTLTPEEDGGLMPATPSTTGAFES